MAASTSHLIHHFLRTSPPPSKLISLFLKRTVSLPTKTPLRKTPFSSLSLSLSTSSQTCSLNPLHVEKQEIYSDPIDEPEGKVSEAEEKVSELEGKGREQEIVKLDIPSLSVKEKKELASYANSLGKKLKSQLVGKSGITSSVAASFSETLEANELLKIKIHGTCPGELPDVVKQLEEATGSVVVGQIGRTVIIYRPSITKMKAEEKRQQHQRMFVRKTSTLKPTLEKRGPVPRLYGQRRRGSSRV